MTNATHTPGPWHLYGYDVGTAPDETIATVCALDGDTDDANARLIAAAPELLAALEGLLEDALALGLAESELSGSAIEARAAIAKALGE